jgi:succinyl-CoA synthetase beta subunit
MSVIDRIAYATLLKAGRAQLAGAVPIEKNMEDDASETRVKRQRHEGVSDSEVEGNIKQEECATELSGIGTQCAQGSPSHMMWQQDVQMNENEIYVESVASNRHEDQRIEIGSQRGGVPLSGCRRRPKALSQSDEGEMELEND